MKAYVFINVEAGKAREVIEALRDLPGVQSVNACWGRPDLIAEVEAASDAALRDLILDTIHNTEGVEDTETHSVIEL